MKDANDSGCRCKDLENYPLESWYRNLACKKEKSEGRRYRRDLIARIIAFAERHQDAEEKLIRLHGGE